MRTIHEFSYGRAHVCWYVRSVMGVPMFVDIWGRFREDPCGVGFRRTHVRVISGGPMQGQPHLLPMYLILRPMYIIWFTAWSSGIKMTSISQFIPAETRQMRSVRLYQPYHQMRNDQYHTVILNWLHHRIFLVTKYKGEIKSGNAICNYTYLSRIGLKILCKVQ